MEGATVVRNKKKKKNGPMVQKLEQIQKLVSSPANEQLK